MGWFFKTDTDKLLKEMGLDADAFKQVGEYDLLIKSIKKLDSSELQEARTFSDTAMAGKLDCQSEIDRLSDTQIIVVFSTIQQAVAEKCEILGPMVRAHAIINNAEYVKEHLDELKKQKEVKEEIKDMRISLKNIYKKMHDGFIASNKPFVDIGYSDFLALLGDVRFKFIVPIVNF